MEEERLHLKRTKRLRLFLRMPTGHFIFRRMKLFMRNTTEPFARPWSATKRTHLWTDCFFITAIFTEVSTMWGNHGDGTGVRSESSGMIRRYFHTAMRRASESGQTKSCA